MEKKNWKRTLLVANEDLSNYELGIRVVFGDETEIWSHARAVSERKKILQNDDEIADGIMEVWSALLDKICLKEKSHNGFSFKIVKGGTHDLPALVAAFSDVTLYFHEVGTLNFEIVENIDDFEGRAGSFCVHREDYPLAMKQVIEHDELGIER